ncbi:MAG: hypothetical protein PHP57_06395 [Sideroxydans sp.]|nr:hypothetical protein [Sideroxydans sp.]
MSDNKSAISEFIAKLEATYNNEKISSIVSAVVLIVFLGIAFLCGSFWQSQQDKSTAEMNISLELSSISKSCELASKAAHIHQNP